MARYVFLKDALIRLPKVEQIPIKLRNLYESYGYTKYRMAKFEPYDLYREHKGFLKSEGILTFNDKKGRLLALKPDVTISIVNSVKPEDKEGKFFYVENVYRLESGDYREIEQIGLEYIGGDTLYSELEVLYLAYESLATVSDSFVLNIGHTGIWSHCLDALGFNQSESKEVFTCIKNKNLHGLKDLLVKKGLSDTVIEDLIEIASISAPISEGVARLNTLLGDGYSEYLDELDTVYEAIIKTVGEDKIYLDMSVLNDMTYYNGIVFQGFVKGLSKVLLSGGRYDNLVKTFGKNQKAVGFAIYTEELARVFREQNAQDSKVILHDDAVEALRLATLSVKDGDIVKVDLGGAK